MEFLFLKFLKVEEQEHGGKILGSWNLGNKIRLFLSTFEKAWWFEASINYNQHTSEIFLKKSNFSFLVLSTI